MFHCTMKRVNLMHAVYFGACAAVSGATPTPTTIRMSARSYVATNQLRFVKHRRQTECWCKLWE